MAWLTAHWQEILTGAVLAAAGGYLVRGWYRAVKRAKYGASCGACSHNPENQERPSNLVSIEELLRGS